MVLAQGLPRGFKSEGGWMWESVGMEQPGDGWASLSLGTLGASPCR